MTKLLQILAALLLAAGCAQEPAHSSIEEREMYLLHEGLHRVAALSLKILQTTDASDTSVDPLRTEARAHLLVYADEVEALRSQYDWSILGDDLITQVSAYLQEVETEPPNQ